MHNVIEQVKRDLSKRNNLDTTDFVFQIYLESLKIRLQVLRLNPEISDDMKTVRFRKYK